jgi:sugar phosphate isomerase/epimerase
MPAPIAIQLYSVRDALAEDFAGVVKKIAAMGYLGVEPAGFPGATATEAASLFRELELAVPSAHTPMPVGDEKNEVLDTMAALGCRRIVSGIGPDRYKTIDQIKRNCDRFNEASAVAVANGLTFGIHNHWWEFEQVEGRYPYKVMLECLDSAAFFEVDTYWVKTAGPDPAEVVRELGQRAPLLHIKDGPAVKGEPQVALGEGVMDFLSIVRAGEGATEWLIVELDACATDMMTAVEKSYRYLVGEGLARGRR